jgi:hypothetical protein
MPEIPTASVLSYLGVVALIFSVFLILAGLNVVQIEKISVAPGRRTWGIGILLALAGGAFLWLDNRSVEEPGPPTPAPIAAATSATIPTTAPVETATFVPPSSTPTPITPAVTEVPAQGPTETPTTISAEPPTPAPVTPPTSASTAADTPTPSPRPPRELLVEDFEDYKNDASLAESFEINRNAGNDGWIRLVGAPHAGQGLQAMAFEFDIPDVSSGDYIGLNREFPTQDWSGYSFLCVWIESDGSNRGLVIQFGESMSGFCKQEQSLSQGTGDYCISLKEQNCNPKAVGYYGIYVNGPPEGRSIIYVDTVRVVE